MKYVLIVLACVVSIIAGIAIGMRLNNKTTPVVVIAPGTSNKLVQCSDLLSADQLKSIVGTVSNVSGSTTLSIKLFSNNFKEQ